MPSTGKIMLTVLGFSQTVAAHFMKRGETECWVILWRSVEALGNNSQNNVQAYYCRNLAPSRQCQASCNSIHPGENWYVWVATSWTSPLQPQLDPKGLSLVWYAKTSPWRQTFREDEDAEREVRTWLRSSLKNSMQEVFGTLVKRWDKSVNVGGVYVEK